VKSTRFIGYGNRRNRPSPAEAVVSTAGPIDFGGGGYSSVGFYEFGLVTGLVKGIKRLTALISAENAPYKLRALA
jgi:hypothetical protein